MRKEHHYPDRGSRGSMTCPHCLQSTRIRTSRGVSATYRQLNLQCTNPECGATYGASLSIDSIISPSAVPNPAIALKVATPRTRAMPAATRAPANDGIVRIGSHLAANENDQVGEALAT